MIFSEKLVEQDKSLKSSEPNLILMLYRQSCKLSLCYPRSPHRLGAALRMQVMDPDAKQVSEVTGLKLKMAGNPEQPHGVGGFPNDTRL